MRACSSRACRVPQSVVRVPFRCPIIPTREASDKIPDYAPGAALSFSKVSPSALSSCPGRGLDMRSLKAMLVKHGEHVAGDKEALVSRLAAALLK